MELLIPAVSNRVSACNVRFLPLFPPGSPANPAGRFAIDQISYKEINQQIGHGIGFANLYTLSNEYDLIRMLEPGLLIYYNW